MRITVPFLTFFILFQLISVLMRNEYIYHQTLDKVAINAVHTPLGNIQSHQPFLKPDNSNMINFDAEFYKFIMDHGYNLTIAGKDFVFAFPPMFPYIWKITLLPPIGIPFLNFFFFIIGIIILSRCLKERSFLYSSWPLAILPGLVVFLIPYSEAVFFATISLAIFGRLKNNYPLFFIGLMLAAMTRSVALIIMISFFMTELFFFFSGRKLRFHLVSFLKNILPILTGTIIVSLIQLLYKSGSFFKFAEVHKYWNHTFSIPGPASDWSTEGFGISVASIFIIGIPALAFIFLHKKKPNEKENMHSYFYLLSSFFLGGSVLFVIFFQQGSLHSLFRYIVCSPFFIFLLFTTDIRKIEMRQRIFFFLLCFFSAIFYLSTSHYGNSWDFSDTGFFLLFFSVGLWLFQDKINLKLFHSLAFILVFINAVWTAYLFNMYLSGTWLFL